MKVFRRITVFLIILFVLSFSTLSAESEYYAGKGLEEKTFFVLDPAMVNVYATEQNWLPSAIASPLKENLKQFTGLSPINFSNTAAIQEIQKKFESGAYDATSAVTEAGKLLDANYGVFVTVTKTSSTYQFAVSITNLTTGREEATTTINNIKEATALQDAAINEALIRLAPQLGVQLSELGTYTLEHGTEGTLSELKERFLFEKQRAEEAARKAAAAAKYNSQPDLPSGIGLILSGGWSLGAGTGLAADGGLVLRLPQAGISAGALMLPYDGSEMMLFGTAGVELDIAFNFFKIKKCFFLLGGTGGVLLYKSIDTKKAFVTSGNNNYLIEGLNQYKAGSSFDISLLGVNAGFYIPLTRKLALKTQYSLYWLKPLPSSADRFMYDTVSAGILFCL